MKIKDVILGESPAGTSYQHNMSAQDWRNYAELQKKQGVAPVASQQFPLTPDAQRALSPTPVADKGTKGQSAQPKKAAKSDPAVLARQQELIAAGAKIKADGVMGPKTREAEKQFGPKVDAAKSNQTAGTATTVTNPAQAAQAPTMSDRASDPNVAGVAREPDTSSTAPAPDSSGPDAPSAELDRLKQLAIGQNTLNQQASQQGAAMAQAAQTPTPAPNTNPLGVTAQAANAFGQPAPTPDKPNTQTGQAAQPQPQPKDPTVAPELKSGTGQTWTDSSGKAVRSSSDDEIAWANANPANRFNPNGYPGPGNWDPKTGRTVQKDKQGNVIQQKGFGDTISDFGTSVSNFFQGKKAPTTPAAQGDQSGGSTTGNKAFLPGAAGGAKEDIDILKKLSGL